MYLIHLLGADIIAKAQRVLFHLTKAYTPKLYKDVLFNKIKTKLCRLFSKRPKLCHKGDRMKITDFCVAQKWL